MRSIYVFVAVVVVYLFDDIVKGGVNNIYKRYNVVHGQITALGLSIAHQ